MRYSIQSKGYIDPMRIAVLSESLLLQVRDEPGLYVVDPWIRIIEMMATECASELNLVAPVLSVTSTSQVCKRHWHIRPANIKLFPLPPYTRYVSYYRQLFSSPFRFIGTIFQAFKVSDLVVLRGPSPATTPFILAAKFLHKPIVIFLLSDITQQPDQLRSPRLYRRILARGIVSVLALEEFLAVRAADFIFPYSRDISRRNRIRSQKMLRVQDPHVRLSSFHFRDDSVPVLKGWGTPQNPIKLLRVCWLIPSKGLTTLIKSLGILKSRGLCVSLTICGDERKAGYKETLTDLVNSLGLTDEVSFIGWVPHDTLDQIYISHNIHVLSSLAEGTPRVMIEAFSKGLPSVITRVGSVADEIVDRQEALIIPAADSIKMANSIEEIVSNHRLRQHLIKSAYVYAKRNSFEGLFNKIWDAIKAVSDNAKNGNL